MNPEFLAAALHAYMDSFHIYQEDLSTYSEDEATGERTRTSAHILKHVLVADELPSMQGFSVRMKTPIKVLRDMYNTRQHLDPPCPWCQAVDVFRSFQESAIASAAAFDLINAGFAKDIMKQWAGWQTDTITLNDSTPKPLNPTEAAARIAGILSRLGVQPAAISPGPLPTPAIDVTPTAVTAQPAPVASPLETIAQKRRPRKVTA
jgi:hypothetical protein